MLVCQCVRDVENAGGASGSLVALQRRQRRIGGSSDDVLCQSVVAGVGTAGSVMVDMWKWSGDCCVVRRSAGGGF
ncbi:MAG: hypothetical protein ACOVRM_00745 [Planctomycetaceae bacterium]